jgi:hypothetical protein
MRVIVSNRGGGKEGENEDEVNHGRRNRNTEGESATMKGRERKIRGR